ncbi:hypothetical protein GGD50_002872 [Rhizobium paranaense]|uniref:Uncharacterized protein n=1 Tax=Rhizobium paranaense TaxID=1650438 RepID=A0A7W8XRV1_9HYPH|nr:hypothetical protein [Rhizobium paranaense]
MTKKISSELNQDIAALDIHPGATSSRQKPQPRG